MFLSVYRPPSRRQSKLTNTMFLEQFSDLSESYVSCDRLFVVGDLNVHFDKSSDPSTSALNVVQLVNVPTHWLGHTLDSLITNRVTDVLDLTVVDMLLSDHLFISFDLLLRKPVRAFGHWHQVKSSLTLPLCPSLVVIYYPLSLLETLVFTLMKRCPWMHILNTCAAFCSVSWAELEKSTPSCQLMLPTNLLFLSFSLG